VHADKTGTSISTDLHPQGNVWIGSFNAGFGDCTWTVDGAALTLVEDCSSFGTLAYSLSRNG
jgi:hypothetical protein